MTEWLDCLLNKPDEKDCLFFIFSNYSTMNWFGAQQ